jgi:hypothetical protein
VRVQEARGPVRQAYSAKRSRGTGDHRSQATFLLHDPAAGTMQLIRRFAREVRTDFSTALP